MKKYYSTYNNRSVQIILTLSFLSLTRQSTYLLFIIHFQYHKSCEATNVMDNSDTCLSVIKLFKLEALSTFSTHVNVRNVTLNPDK